ncbi:hypothetical protein PY62_08625, partial [Lacticaseibacillus rhamnosus]
MRAIPRFLAPSILKSSQRGKFAPEPIGRDLTDVDSVFITHEHSDHVRGVGVLARRYPQLNVYANAKTFAALPKSVGKIPEA